MKKIVLLFGIMLMMAGCSGAEPETPPTAEAPSTAETAETVEATSEAETDPDFLITTVAPGGKEYTSTDGINWQCDGEESDAPLVFLTMTAEDPIRISSDKRYMVTIHNRINSGQDWTQGSWALTYGDYTLTRLDNGKWVKPDMVVENVASDLMESFIPDGFSKDIFFNSGLYAPVEGRYRLEVRLEDVDYLDYTCSIEFNAVA